MNIKRTGSMFFSGVLMGLFIFVGVSSAVRPVPAKASLGNDIVCFVFSTLNVFGEPIPHLDANNCPSTPPTGSGTLKVMKVVVGGTATASDFSIHVKSGGTEIGGSPQPGSTSGTSYIGITPGDYTVSETGGPANYTASFVGCNSSGNITVASSSVPKVCTITNTYVAPPSGVENTLALCSDSIDNNDNGLVDLADPDCAAFKPKLTVTVVVSGGTLAAGNFPLFLDSMGITSGTATTTTTGAHTVTQTGTSTYSGVFSGACDSGGHVTLAIGDNKSCTLTNTFIGGNGGTETTQCNDAVDNDADGLIDSADPGCHTDFNAGNSASYDATRNNESATAPSGGGGPTVTPTTGGGGGGGGGGIISGPLSFGYGGGGGYLTPGLVLGTSTGAVLGTTTSCGLYLTDYLRIGRANNMSQVIKLQTFLNSHLGLKLPVSGFFGPLTDAAVRKFQAQYAVDVLEPWVPLGLGARETTGYVYKTTQRKINLIMCSELILPLPMLP